MSQALIAFFLGLFVGVPLGFILLSLLVMAREGGRAVESIRAKSCDCRPADGGVVACADGVIWPQAREWRR